MSSNLTLSQYLQQQNGNLTPELAQVIETIADTCKTIDQALQKGALAGILGSAGNENIQGETQKKLDVISNDYLIDALKVHPQVGGLASEELDDFTPAQENGKLCITYQTTESGYNARSFEDAFIHINREFIKSNKDKFKGLKNKELFETDNDAYDLAAKCIKKKTYFAMDIIFHTNETFNNWEIPSYIKEGLLWLKKD